MRLLLCLLLSSCVSQEPFIADEVHETELIVTVCAGPLCAICGTNF